MRIAVVGCGKMGSLIAQKASASGNFQLCACIDAAGGRELCGVAVRPASELESVLRECKPDVAIDFSGAEATAANAPTILKHADMVIGTTGFTPEQKAALAAAVRASGRGAVISPNMSIEMNVLFDVVAHVARMVPDADVAIYEEHHTRKKDAPSGSAKRLAECVGRQAQVSSARVGNVVGKHTVSFVLGNERLDFTHEAYSREAFADGALTAAEFVHGKKGVFSMADAIAGGRAEFREFSR